MNSSLRRRRLMSLPLALTWSHFGALYRVTPWPEVRFERHDGEEWLPVVPAEDTLAAAARAFATQDWRPYLDFVPADIRAFLGGFTLARLEALQVAARCPGLLPELVETPALTSYVAAHAGLRGTEAPAWDEINAVHERGGIFAVLEWLGLPAARQTLAVLQNVAEPTLPRRFLESLRSLLWEPQAISALLRMPEITDRALAHCCHALAA